MLAHTLIKKILIKVAQLMMRFLGMLPVTSMMCAIRMFQKRGLYRLGNITFLIGSPEDTWAGSGSP